MADGAETPDRRLCVGVITGAHGVRGQVKIKSFTEFPEDVASYGPVEDRSGKRRFALDIAGETRGQLIVRVEGVRDRNAAEALKGTELYIDRDILPEPDEDEFYHSDLIGLAAETMDGAAYGTVRAMHDFGAGDLIEIALAEGGVVLLPFTREVVPEIDLDAGLVRIAPPAEIVVRPDAHLSEDLSSEDVSSEEGEGER